MYNANEISTLDLEAFTYHAQYSVLPELTTCLDDGGCWLLERRALSATTMEFRIELRLESVLEFYGSLMGTVIELTCNAHATLTDLCTCRRNAAQLCTVGGTIVLRLVLHFREELTMPMLFATSCAAA